MHTWLIALPYLVAPEQPSPPTPACPAPFGLDAGSVASLASAVIALGALAVAWWVARGSSRAARSSETSARAAEQTVELTRQAQHRAERPEFVIEVTGPERGQLDAYVQIRMVSGPTQIKVAASYIGTVQWPMPDAPHEMQGRMVAGEGSGCYTLVKNDEWNFPVEVVHGARLISLKVILQCDSDDEREARQWHHAEIVEWTAPPSSRSRKVVVLR